MLVEIVTRAGQQAQCQQRGEIGQRMHMLGEFGYGEDS
jgi:hypothetical protein